MSRGRPQKPKSEEKSFFLPARRAFVIQFSMDTEVQQSRLTGRAEHVMSGQSTHFSSLDDLLGFLAQVLSKNKRQEKERSPMKKAKSLLTDI